MVATVKRCKCGRRMGRDRFECTQCSREAHAKSIEEACKIVEGGKCPWCGSGLRRNSALAGWWQCEQYGAVGFRKDANRPDCGFQCFTE